MRSETFPYPDRFVMGPHGPLCYFDTGVQAAAAAAAEGNGHSATPLLMLHALGTNFTQFEYVVPALARPGGVRVLGLDLPGCGHSSKPRRAWRIDDISRAVLKLLDHLGIQRVAILGHSFGGRIALDLALRHPERVLGLVLLNSAGLLRFSPFVRRFVEHAGPTLLSPNLVAGAIMGSFRLILQHIFSPKARSSPRAQRFMHQVRDRYDVRFAWEFAYHACPLLPELVDDVIDELPRIKVPVQVVWGARDELLRLADVRPVLAKLAQVELTELPEVGHMPTLEHPEAVVAAAHRLLHAIAATSPVAAHERA